MRSFGNERESFSRKVALDCEGGGGREERERERERGWRVEVEIRFGTARRFVRGNPNERAGEHLQSGSNFIVSAKSSPLTLNNLRRPEAHCVTGNCSLSKQSIFAFYFRPRARLSTIYAWTLSFRCDPPLRFFRWPFWNARFGKSWICSKTILTGMWIMERANYRIGISVIVWSWCTIIVNVSFAKSFTNIWKRSGSLLCFMLQTRTFHLWNTKVSNTTKLDKISNTMKNVKYHLYRSKLE